MAYGVESQGKTLTGPREYAYPKKVGKRVAASKSDKTDGQSGTKYASGYSGEGATSNAKMYRGTRDSMSTGDMADELPLKITRVKKMKSAVKAKGVPAGAQTGALGSAPLERVTTGLRTIFRTRGGSPAGNPTGEINLRA